MNEQLQILLESLVQQGLPFQKIWTSKRLCLSIAQFREMIESNGVNSLDWSKISSKDLVTVAADKVASVFVSPENVHILIQRIIVSSETPDAAVSTTPTKSNRVYSQNQTTKKLTSTKKSKTDRLQSAIIQSQKSHKIRCFHNFSHLGEPQLENKSKNKDFLSANTNIKLDNKMHQLTRQELNKFIDSKNHTENNGFLDLKNKNYGQEQYDYQLTKHLPDDVLSRNIFESQINHQRELSPVEEYRLQSPTSKSKTISNYQRQNNNNITTTQNSQIRQNNNVALKDIQIQETLQRIDKEQYYQLMMKLSEMNDIAQQLKLSKQYVLKESFGVLSTKKHQKFVVYQINQNNQKQSLLSQKKFLQIYKQLKKLAIKHLVPQQNHKDLQEDLKKLYVEIICQIAEIGEQISIIDKRGITT